ncbi:MAG: DeoR/GlpR family DNA-binding transcription regulator [Lachnospiraceae bacterium]
MLTEERYQEILLELEEKGLVTVQELTQRLDASESTIRRDLTELEHRGKLSKIHGGAKSLDVQFSTMDVEMAVRNDLNQSEKMIIGKYAANLIQPNDFVFIDAGSTTEKLVEAIQETRCTYVTNSMMHGKRLADKGCKVYILGGEVKERTEAIVGEEAVSSLGKYNFTIGFWGTNAVTGTHGFTTPDVSEASVKQKAMKQTKQCYVLCDASKFNQVSPVQFAEFQDAIIITDKLTDESYRKYKNILEVDA